MALFEEIKEIYSFFATKEEREYPQKLYVKHNEI